MKKICSLILLLIFFTLPIEAWIDPLQIASYKATIVDLQTKQVPLYEELDDPPYYRHSGDITDFLVYLDDGLVLDCNEWHMSYFPEYFKVGEEIEVHLYTKLNGYLFAQLIFSNREKHRFWGVDPYYMKGPYDLHVEITDIKKIPLDRTYTEILIALTNGKILKSIGACYGVEKLKAGDKMACYYYPREDGQFNAILYVVSMEGIGPFIVL